MDKYNPDGKCIKCGSGEIKNRHIEGGPDAIDFHIDTSNVEGMMERTCDMAKAEPIFEVDDEVSVKVDGMRLKCKITNVNERLKRVSVVPVASLDVPFEHVIKSAPTTFKASDINPPEIEVGDEVHGRCDHTTCKVIGIDPVEKTCAIQCTEMLWCVCDSNDANNDTPLHLKDLTLISKGPSKRHVEIVISDGCSALPMGIYTGSVELKGEDSQ